MKIRRAKKEEIPLIVELHKSSIVPIWEKLGREYDLLKIEDYIKKNFNKEKFYLIEENGKIIGCGSIMFGKSKEYAHLGMILISEKFQGKGYGKEIMEFLENFAKKKGVEEILLDVLIENPAVKFYKKLGYGEFKYQMKKNLK